MCTATSKTVILWRSFVNSNEWHSSLWTDIKPSLNQHTMYVYICYMLYITWCSIYVYRKEKKSYSALVSWRLQRPLQQPRGPRGLPTVSYTSQVTKCSGCHWNVPFITAMEARFSPCRDMAIFRSLRNCLSYVCGCSGDHRRILFVKLLFYLLKWRCYEMRCPVSKG